MIKEKLRELGFSEKEVSVYLALLEMGSAVASDIAKKAGVKRSTAYVILDSLSGRGLVSMSDRRGVSVYQAAPPQQLVQYLERTAKRYMSLADAAKDLLPELKASHAQNPPAPKVQLFEGPEGMRTVYEDTLASLEAIRVHANFAVAREDASGSRAGRRLKDRDMTVKTIVLNTPGDRARLVPDKEALRKILMNSRGENAQSSEMDIYDDRVIFISPSESFALVVESKELAAALKKMSDASAQETTRAGKAVSGKRVTPGEFAPTFG